MYKVLLVDDEPRALTGIRKTFRWEQEGFEVIAAVIDSIEALEIIKKEKPDVVFTDIKMPVINGIQLIGKSREMGMDTEFIVISGFADFSYARDALRHGAFDYCLKPLDFEEADSLLKRLANHLRFKERLADTAVFEKLMEERSNAQELLREMGLEFKYPFYLGCVILHPDGIMPEQPWRALGKTDVLTFHLSVRKEFVLINTGDPGKILEETAVTEKISYGYSKTAGELNLIKLYREADIAANSCFITQKHGVWQYRPRNLNLINEIVKKIQEFVKNNDYSSLQTMLIGLPSFFEDNSLFLEDLVYLWNRLTALFMKAVNSEETVCNLDFVAYETVLLDYPNMDSLCGYLLNELKSIRLAESTHEILQGIENSSFRNLLQYVNVHFNERLFLGDLAKKFYMNESYCCTMFKKVTGTTFSEYMLKLRMEKAFHLLVHENFSIGEITQYVGYDDYFYFSRVYKKYYGKTATEHKKLAKNNI